MLQSQGYTDSQTWQAWYENWLVVYGNASLVLLTSFLLSLLAAAVVYLLPVLSDASTDQPTEQEGETAAREDESDEIEEDKRKKLTEDTSDDCHDESSGLSRSRKAALEELKQEGVACPFGPQREGLRARGPAHQPRLSPFYQRKEMEVKNEQLATIHRLMQEQQEKFGATTLEDLRSQMKLYTS